MTSRELVRRTLEFRSPPRTPRQAWVLPWAEGRYPEDVRRLRSAYPDDIVTCPGLYRSPLPVTGSRYAKGTYVDEWGCRFSNLHDGVMGSVQEPLVADWADLEKFNPPEATLDVDRDAVNAFCRGTDRFVIAGTLVRPFERLIFIRTMAQALTDLLLQPPGFLRLLGRVHAHYLQEVEAWARTDIDAIEIMDDWGAQHRLMVAPAVFRRLFKPLYAEYCEIARRHGKYVFMHSDGYIADIVGDLIEAGVDALNSQIECMGAETLGRRFRGRITFWGEMDRRRLLPFGTAEEIESAVREVREHLYAEGGVIAQCEFGPGAKPENVTAVFRAWEEVDRGAASREGDRSPPSPNPHPRA